MSVQGAQDRVQHTALRRPSAECQGGGAGGAYLNRLWVVSQEVLDPGTGGGGESYVSQLIHQDVRDDVLNAEL